MAATGDATRTWGQIEKVKSGASADDVLARADADGAPFAANEELRALLRRGLDEIPRE